MQNLRLPSFFLTNTTGLANGLLECLIALDIKHFFEVLSYLLILLMQNLPIRIFNWCIIQSSMWCFTKSVLPRFILSIANKKLYFTEKALAFSCCSLVHPLVPSPKPIFVKSTSICSAERHVQFTSALNFPSSSEEWALGFLVLMPP